MLFYFVFWGKNSFFLDKRSTLLNIEECEGGIVQKKLPCRSGGGELCVRCCIRTDRYAGIPVLAQRAGCC